MKTYSNKVAKVRLKLRRYKLCKLTSRRRRKLHWYWRKIWSTLRKVGNLLRNSLSRLVEEGARRLGEVREKSRLSSLGKRQNWTKRKAKWSLCLSRIKQELLVSNRSRSGLAASSVYSKEEQRWLKKKSKPQIEENETPCEYQEDQNQQRRLISTHL